MLLKSICEVFESLEPKHTSVCEKLGQDFRAVGLWHRFAQARSRWPSRSRSNLFSQICLLTDGKKKHLYLARQELRVVGEVEPLLISMFQWVRAKERSGAGSGANQDAVPDSVKCVRVPLTAQQTQAATLVCLGDSK